MKRGAVSAASPAVRFNPSARLSPEERARRQAYLDQLDYAVITTMDHAHFEGTFRLFGSMFHTDGQPWVSRSRFQQLFGYNTDPRFQAQWGPVSHAMVCARDPVTGQVVGGAIHAAMVPPAHVCKESGIDAIYLGSYIFCAPEARGSGLALRLVREREASVKTYAREVYAARGRTCANPRLLGFNEQNDPLKMTPTEVLEDIQASGLTPWDRLTSSRAKAGWRWVDPRFSYVDPGRDDDAGSDHLRLGAKGEGCAPPPDQIPASLLIHFLGQCAAIRLDGQSPQFDPTYVDQVIQLRRLGTLHPVNDGTEMARLAPRFNKLVKQAQARDPHIKMGEPIGQQFAREDARRAAVRASSGRAANANSHAGHALHA